MPINHILDLLVHQTNCSRFSFGMAFQTRAQSPLLVVILFIYLSCTIIVSAQYSPRYACDTDKNPKLKMYKFCDTSLEINTRVNDLVKRMTLQEKAGSLVSVADSISRLGIPSYGWWSEALHGVSDTGPATWFNKSVIPGATSFPQVILTAASFNESLFYAIGKVHVIGKILNSLILGQVVCVNVVNYILKFKFSWMI